MVYASAVPGSGDEMSVSRWTLRITPTTGGLRRSVSAKTASSMTLRFCGSGYERMRPARLALVPGVLPDDGSAPGNEGRHMNRFKRNAVSSDARALLAMLLVNRRR